MDAAREYNDLVAADPVAAAATIVGGTIAWQDMDTPARARESKARPPVRACKQRSARRRAPSRRRGASS
jgi:hypothetical protein